MTSIIFNAFINAATIIDDSFNIRLNWSRTNDPQDTHEIHRVLFTIGIFLAHSVPFYFLNIGFQLLVDLVPMYKLSPFRFNGPQLPPPRLVLEAIAVTTFYHIAAPIFMFFYGSDAILRMNPNLMSPDHLPSSIWVFIFQLAVCFFFTDFLFYAFHKFLHENPILYNQIHKIHHRFIISVGFAAEYAHPVEWIFGNILPVIFAALFFKFHAVVWFSWITIAISGTVIAHCGFKHFDVLTFSWRDSQIHDFHHTHQNTNYGHTLMFDFLFGTDKLWRKYWAVIDNQNHNNEDQDNGKNIKKNRKKEEAESKKQENVVTPVAVNRKKRTASETKNTRKRSSSQTKTRTNSASKKKK